MGRGIDVFFHILVFAILTMLTQVGGVFYVLYLLLVKELLPESWTKRNIIDFLFFVLFYLLGVFLIVPSLASVVGRKALPIKHQNIRPVAAYTFLMNRHYVKKDVYPEVLRLSALVAEKYPGSKVTYLDAGFPFWDKFPLLPHLGHKDGRKVDLAFMYDDVATGAIKNGSPATLGYGVFEAPKKGEFDQTQACLNEKIWLYGYSKYLTLPFKKHKMVLNEARTKFLLKQVTKLETVEKVFIEPHLKKRWGFSRDSKVRFQGCKSVRHDDHIHIEFLDPKADKK